MTLLTASPERTAGISVKERKAVNAAIVMTKLSRAFAPKRAIRGTKKHEISGSNQTSQADTSRNSIIVLPPQFLQTDGFQLA